MVAADDENVMANQAGASGQAGASSQAVVIHEQPGDKPEDILSAVAAAKRLEKLKRMRAEALEARVPSALFAVDREVQQLERGFHIKDGRRRLENAILRRAVEAAAPRKPGPASLAPHPVPGDPAP